MITKSAKVSNNIIGLRNLSSFDSAISFTMDAEQRRHLFLAEFQTAAM